VLRMIIACEHKLCANCPCNHSLTSTFQMPTADDQRGAVTTVARPQQADIRLQAMWQRFGSFGSPRPALSCADAAESAAVQRTSFFALQPFRCELGIPTHTHLSEPLRPACMQRQPFAYSVCAPHSHSLRIMHQLRQKQFRPCMYLRTETLSWLPVAADDHTYCSSCPGKIAFPQIDALGLPSLCVSRPQGLVVTAWCYETPARDTPV
jgi:hypothetical protein